MLSADAYARLASPRPSGDSPVSISVQYHKFEHLLDPQLVALFTVGTFRRWRRGGARGAQQTPTAACVGCCFLFRFGRNLVKCSSLLPSSEGSSEIKPELRFSCRMDGKGGSSMWIGTSSRALSRSNSISEIKQIPKQRVMQRG